MRSFIVNGSTVGLLKLGCVQGFLGGSVVKNPPAKQEMQIHSLGQEDPLEKEMATYFSILAGKSHGQRNLADYSS